MSEHPFPGKKRGAIGVATMVDSDSEPMREALAKLRAVAPTRTTVRGWVEVYEEDEEGRAQSVYIDDADQGWFVVESDKNGSRLLQHVGDEVEVEGVVSVDPEDEEAKRIRVMKFRILHEPQKDPQEDDET